MASGRNANSSSASGQVSAQQLGQQHGAQALGEAPGSLNSAIKLPLPGLLASYETWLRQYAQGFETAYKDSNATSWYQSGWHDGRFGRDYRFTQLYRRPVNAHSQLARLNQRAAQYIYNHSFRAGTEVYRSLPSTSSAVGTVNGGNSGSASGMKRLTLGHSGRGPQ